jgi:hypothetical protein
MGVEDSLITYDDLAALVEAQLHSYGVPQPRRFIDDAYQSYPNVMAGFDAVMAVGVEDGDVQDLADIIFALPFVQDSLDVREVCRGV